MMRQLQAQLMDEAVAWNNTLSSAFLQGMAGLARMAFGQGPVPVRSGPAHPGVLRGERPGARLLHHPARAPHVGSVVVVSSLINRFYVLDLLPHISVLDVLCRHGLDVFVLDWTPPGADGLARDFASYVDGLIPWAAEVASDGKPGGVHVLGYCMGGTMAAMHAALHPHQVRTLTLLGTPIDFHASGVLNTFTDPRWFDPDLMVDAFGNIPPVVLQSGFKLLNPANAVLKFRDLMARGDDAAGVEHFVAVESWLEDNLAFPGGLYGPYIRQCYQQNLLPQGRLEVAGRRVDLATLDMPIQNLVGLKDTIVAPLSSHALMDLVASTDTVTRVFDGGHIGLSTSRRALTEMWPAAAQWMVQRSNPDVAAQHAPSAREP